MHVEDHPLEYGGFEGVIPVKQYGGGTVMLWDRGTWIPVGDPAAGYEKGHLKFELKGEKLKGGWTLVRTRGSKYGNGKEAWLLIKENDDYAQRGRKARVVDDAPDSAASGRSLAEIASDRDHVWHSDRSVAAKVKAGAIAERRVRKTSGPMLRDMVGARPASLPAKLTPMLATLVEEIPDGEDWIHEIKYDGYRMLFRIDNGAVKVVSRNGNDWTSKLASLAKAAARLKVKSAWIDGEVAIVGAHGRTSFQVLQNALADRRIVGNRCRHEVRPTRQL